MEANGATTRMDDQAPPRAVGSPSESGDGLRWKLRRFVARHGIGGILRLLIHPATLLVTTPFRFGQNMVSYFSRPRDERRETLGFSSLRGVNALFYWTIAENFRRHGRSGVSQTVGLGSYPLSNWFLYTLPSIYAYRRNATAVVFGSMFVWAVAHLIWLSHAPAVLVVSTILLAIISTTFYSNLFIYQNYNALGWAVFPILVYGLMTHQWLLTAVAALAASFASTTVVAIGGLLACVSAAAAFSLSPLVAMIPAGLKILTHFTDRAAIVKLMKAIGVATRNARYTRDPHTKSIRHMTTASYYWGFVYLQFALLYIAFERRLPVIFLAGVLLTLLNATKIRFADVQSIWMLNLSTATATILISGEGWLLLSYWLVVSPLPGFVGAASPGVADRVPPCRPFSPKRLLTALDRFLATVEPGQRVLMAFDDPHGDYGSIFDGYRVLLEAPLYVASTRGFHLMPDWWGVFETNYENSPDWWGRDVDSVRRNATQWAATCVIVYQEPGTTIDPIWEENGFRVSDRFSWSDFASDLQGEPISSRRLPDWWLLRAEENS